ncbi:DUF2207 domain-containing protein [Hydrogenivirga sp. 128-5-R1-1]|uniref:DUF2207 family protein n=1 Tax=Hydrogenivirga sp. 128-5-R1-1 TaxID=392423 RepID=UPI00015F190B|nr:DUF2207 domain-containing protein [Hydrogenivirga sp. 128-5-R1-1]EDP75508.1 hypothetical protein HG1285_16126 [Hydrogenivirga sp. 128-5-R1-1]
MFRGEDRKLFRLIVLALLFSVGVVVLAETDPRRFISGLTATYRAEIKLSERLRLKEVYVFRVKDESRFRMLYRVWRAPLLVEGEIDKPHVRVLSLQGDGITYVKDFKGRVHMGEYDYELAEFVLSKAFNNEVGILNTKTFPPGSYTALFEYEVLPPIEFDERNKHINLKLADRHIYYERVEIRIDDRLNSIEEVFVHIPEFSVKRQGNLWFVEGVAPTDSLVELEFLLRPVGIEGYERYVVGVRARTESANALNTFLHVLRGFIKPLLVAYVLGVPFGLLLLYRKFGSEANFTVPEHLSYVPKPERKPWVVNMLFEGDSTRADENAFYATLIDLERRGFVEIDLSDDDVKIKHTGKVPEDAYEIKLLSFIDRYSYYGKGVFSLKEIKRLLDSYVESNNKYGIRRLKKDFEEVFEFRDRKLVKEFLSTRGHRLMKRLGIGVSLLLGIVAVLLFFLFRKEGVYAYDVLVLALGGVVVSNLPWILMPPQVFGRWRENHYKEKLEWEAFKNFLSDMAMLQKYSPDDVSVWKEWLIYAIALGVADKVEEALSKLKVDIPEVWEGRYMRMRLSLLYSDVGGAYRAVVVGGSSGKGFGGGFGVGGGFGGGGAGGR